MQLKLDGEWNIICVEILTKKKISSNINLYENITEDL